MTVFWPLSSPGTCIENRLTVWARFYFRTLLLVAVSLPGARCLDTVALLWVIKPGRVCLPASHFSLIVLTGLPLPFCINLKICLLISTENMSCWDSDLNHMGSIDWLIWGMLTTPGCWQFMATEASTSQHGAYLSFWVFDFFHQYFAVSRTQILPRSC